MNTNNGLVHAAILTAASLLTLTANADVPATLVAMSTVKPAMTTKVETRNDALTADLAVALEAEILADLAKRLPSEVAASLTNTDR